MPRRKRNQSNEIILNNSKTIFSSVTQIVSDAIIIFDSSGEILFFNQAAEILSGYSSEEIIGQNYTHLMPEAEREKHQNLIITQVISNPGFQHSDESEILCKEGEQKQVSIVLKATEVWDRMIGIAILRSRTDQKLAEENLRRYQDTIQLLTEQKLFAENELNLLSCQLKKNLAEYTEKLTEFTDALKKENQYRQQKEDTIKLYQQKLEQVLDEHADELRQITERYNSELAHVLHNRDEFVNKINRQFRNPLNSILNNANLLEGEIYGPVTPRQQQSLYNIAEEVQQLLNILSLLNQEVGE